MAFHAGGLLDQTQPSLRNKLESADLPPSCCGLIGAYCVCEGLGVAFRPSRTHLEYINQRSHSSSVASYLLSRSRAGMTAEGLADLTQLVSGGRIYSRFFPTRYSGVRQLDCFLRGWLREKAVLVLTINLQRLDKEDTSSEDLADAWHHHPLAGLGSAGRFRMLYPELEYSTDQLHLLLDCDSVLLVRAQDILYQTSPKGSEVVMDIRRLIEDIDVLRTQQDKRWLDLRVSDSVYQLLYDTADIAHDITELKKLKRIQIPADYTPGVTVFIDSLDVPIRDKLDSLPDGLLLERG